MPDHLLIRADASERIGTGHVMRCLALAQGWKRSGDEAVFLAAEISPSLDERLRAAGCVLAKTSAAACSREDAEQTTRLARERGAGWIVADGYSFGADYQLRIKQAGFRLLMLDDYGHAEHYFADLILNQNLHADPALYAKRDAGTRLLLGTRYALLREDFLKYRNWKREVPPVARKVLMTLGGADPDNVTGEVVDALKRFPGIEAKVVIGGSNPHVGQLKSKLRTQESGMELVVDARNMPALMAWADIAIAAGGTTSWELAFMGVPSLLFVLADNQRGVAGGLDAAQAARKTDLDKLAADFGALMSDKAARIRMGESGRQLVDALGVSRVVNHLRASNLSLRRVHDDDCRQIWEWANDPEVRAVSHSQAPISWDDHVKWFSANVHSSSCLFYIAVNSGENPIGQIRFDASGPEAVLSVSVAKEARGHGYGSALIVQGSQRCFADSRVNLIRAFVKPTNQTSIHAFEKTDFLPVESVEQRGQLMRQFILKRETVA